MHKQQDAKRSPIYFIMLGRSDVKTTAGIFFKKSDCPVYIKKDGAKRKMN